MRDWQKYARAREQIYHYAVLVRQMHESISPKRRTPQLVQLMEITEAAVSEAKTCFETGAMLAVEFNRYVPVPLPGFEDYDAELKSPPSWKED